VSRYPAHPQRLVELSPEEDLTGVSALVRAAAASPRELQPAARQRIRGRLRRALAGPAPAFHARWRLALVVLVTLGIGGVVGATTHSVIMRRLAPSKTAEPGAASGRPGKHRVSSRSTPSTPAAVNVPAEREMPPAPALGPPPSSQAPVPSAGGILVVPSQPALPPRLPTASGRSSAPSRGSSSPAPRLAVASSPGVSQPSTTGWSPGPAQKLAPGGGPRPPAEVAVLARAIRTLRVDGNAAAALVLLDEHQAGFGDGSLKHEASAMRIEALLRLGRADAALADLDRLPLWALPRRNEWHVVRGELRAQSGRWSDAETDFATALEAGLLDLGGDLAERALWGRASARSHQGNLGGARTDTLDYLRRFPSGRFAGLAQQAIPAR